MRLGKFFGKVAPVVALVAVAGLAACGDVSININDDDAVPLADLDMDGDAPDEIALGGSDNVVVTSGEEFAITVEGSDAAIERMRFKLEGGTLWVMRDNDAADGDGVATVNVTMPPPNGLTVGGSGSITADAMSSDAEIVIGGSGNVTVAALAADALEVTIGGSGTATVAGSTDRLELSIGGAGSAEMADLQVGDAEVNIGGSGSATFAADGDVEANIGGSGTVRVRGSARCTSNTVGSGRLICEGDFAEATE